MQLYLINPSNPLVSIVNVAQSRWNRFRVWQPLGLMVLAQITPPEWTVTLVDENLARPDYDTMPPPDLVGITAFTSQAPRAYELAEFFRARGVPVVMGGIHATMRPAEAMARAAAVVTGEAEGVWAEVLRDAERGTLQRCYAGGLAPTEQMAPARRDLLPGRYAFGSIQTTRGCPLNCHFCSVTAFNGSRYRQRPLAEVVAEFALIPESRVLVVDDNLIGTRAEHIGRAKQLFRALIASGVRKQWVAQVTINFADDDELLALAARAGCCGVFIGFESPTAAGLDELGKKFNLLKGRNLRESVRRIQRHRMLVVGSFILGLDVDTPGIGRRIARAASELGLDHLNTLFLTPLPGTRLWEQLDAEGRILLNAFPEDWRYYTLTYPVARYRHLTREGVVAEMLQCGRRFYAWPRVARRLWTTFWHRRHPVFSLAGNLSYRNNLAVDGRAYEAFHRRHPAAAPAEDCPR